MLHSMLDPGDVRELLRVFSGTYDLDLMVGRVRLIGRSLPGTAVCAVLRDLGDGVLRIAYDVNKPNAFAHVQAMLREWWGSYLEPAVLSDGTVELVPRTCPEADTAPVRLAVLPREPSED